MISIVAKKKRSGDGRRRSGPRAAIEAKFPRLRRHGFRVTSDPDVTYNCIAWAAGDEARWWWPAELSYWPDGVRQSVALSSFIEAFATIGYSECRDGALEEGFEKVALYGTGKACSHAARQLPNGEWTSKLGRGHDISHHLDGLVDSSYGDVLVLLRRPVGE